MRNLKAILLMAVAVLLFGVTFAQDSTLVNTIQSNIPMLEGKWPFLAKVFGWCLLISEGMALVPEKYIPANGIVHTIWVWFKAIFAKKS